MYAIIPFALAVAAGISIVVQQGMISNLRSELNSAAWSGFMSYLVGLAVMAVLAVAMRDPIPSLAVSARIPWWTWFGGFFGAIFVALSIFLVPKLGVATFLALLVTGQMLGAIVFDHYGWMGLVQRPIDVSRIAGVALLIGGVLLIRR